mgnify:CR=1 FL=1
MKALSIFFSLCLLLLAGQSCKSEFPYAKMAQETCDCLQPMSDLFQKVQQMSEQGLTDELGSLMGELETTAENAEACTDKLSEKYGEPEDEAKAMEAMNKICPAVVEMMNNLDGE